RAAHGLPRDKCPERDLPHGTRTRWQQDYGENASSVALGKPGGRWQHRHTVRTRLHGPPRDIRGALGRLGAGGRPLRARRQASRKDEMGATRSVGDLGQARAELRDLYIQVVVRGGGGGGGGGGGVG